MKLYPKSTDAEIIAELGRRHKNSRISAGLTQSDLADRAGVTRSTVQRFERGDSIQLESFVRLMRVLDRLDALDLVLPERERSPIAELEAEGRRRQRVRRRAGADDGRAQWRWGDEEG